MDISTLAKFTIRGEIAPSGPFLAMFGGENLTTSAQDVRDFIDQNKDASELVFEISSDGGHVTEGFEIHDIIKNCGKKVTTIGYKVNSIAVIAFLAKICN